VAKIGSKADIQDHMKQLLASTPGDQTLVPDAAAAASAAGIPGFSAGTVAMDPGGRVVAPDAATDVPAFTAPPAAANDDADAGAALEAAAAGKPRDPETGKFQPTKAPDQAARPAASAPVAPRTEVQRASAADSAASAILDDWADAEDVEYEGDGGAKFTVRAKKGEAEQVRRGYMRRAQYDRSTSYLNNYRETLEPLIANGRLQQIMPLLQRALQDPEYGEFVAEAYNRRVKGEPLTPQQAQVLQAVGVPTNAAQSTGNPAEEYGLEADPYLAEALRPMSNELAELRTWRAQQTQQAQQATDQQRRVQADQAQRANEVQWGHYDLVQQFPGRFTGDLERDNAALQPIFRYAQESGYVQSYGIRAAIVLAAKALAEERADTGSPAAAVLSQIDRAQLAAANAQAGAARSVGGGGTAAVAPRRRQAPPAPAMTDANGKRKPAKIWAEEMSAYQQQVAALG